MFRLLSNISVLPREYLLLSLDRSLATFPTNVVPCNSLCTLTQAYPEFELNFLAMCHDLDLGAAGKYYAGVGLSTIITAGVDELLSLVSALVNVHVQCMCMCV